MLSLHTVHKMINNSRKSKLELLSHNHLLKLGSRGGFVWVPHCPYKKKALLPAYWLFCMFLELHTNSLEFHPAQIDVLSKTVLVSFLLCWSTFTQHLLYLHKLSTDFSNNINSRTSLVQIIVCNPSGMGRIQNKLPLIVMLWPSSPWLLFSLAAAWSFVVSTRIV